MRSVREVAEAFRRNARVAAKPIDTIFFGKFVRKGTVMKLKAREDFHATPGHTNPHTHVIAPDE